MDRTAEAAALLAAPGRDERIVAGLRTTAARMSGGDASGGLGRCEKEEGDGAMVRSIRGTGWPTAGGMGAVLTCATDGVNMAVAAWWPTLPWWRWWCEASGSGPRMASLKYWWPRVAAGSHVGDGVGRRDSREPGSGLVADRRSETLGRRPTMGGRGGELAWTVFVQC